jgi:4'-phosphopantetheinyl transferase EntD
VKRALFPDEVVFVRSDPQLEAEPLHPAEAALARRMGESRRREFALGRACARRALAQLGIHGVALLRGADRAPLWPTGIIGSLTHTDGFCAAVVARRDDLLALGLDAERERLSQRAAQRVLAAEEREHLARLPSPPGCGFETLAFSAKESVFKALYPLSGVRLGFRDAALAFDPEACSFQVRLRPERAGALPAGACLEGRYRIEEPFVLTSVVVRRLRPAQRSRRSRLAR